MPFRNFASPVLAIVEALAFSDPRIGVGVCRGDECRELLEFALPSRRRLEMSLAATFQIGKRPSFTRLAPQIGERRLGGRRQRFNREQG